MARAEYSVYGTFIRVLKKVGPKKNSRASEHAALASCSVFQGTSTFRPGSQPKRGLFFKQIFGPGTVTRLETVL